MVEVNTLGFLIVIGYVLAPFVTTATTDPSGVRILAHTMMRVTRDD